MQIEIIDELVRGKEVRIDKHSTIQVIGRPIKKGSSAYALMKKGLYVQNGFIKKIESVNYFRAGISYKIEYTNTLYKGNLYFNANTEFKKQIYKGLLNRANVYKIIE